MAFIVTKILKRDKQEKAYYYLVKNLRDGKKIKRIYLMNLNESKNLSEALSKTQKEIKTLSNKRDEIEDRLERMKKGDTSAFYAYSPPYRQVARTTERVQQIKDEIGLLVIKEAQIQEYIELYPSCSASNPN